MRFLTRLASIVIFLVIAALFSFPLSASELRITNVNGHVAFIPKGKSTASPVTVGLPLQQGDRLITSEKGRVEMASKMGTVIQLKEKSYCRIQHISKNKVNFFLRAGQFFGRFAPKSETGIAYSVRTPVIVASMRGTELGVAVGQDGETEGGVIEGVVDFKKPLYGPAATMNWSDEDPRWEEEESIPETTPAEIPVESSTVETSVETSSPTVETSAEETVTVEKSEGISVKPNAAPEKLPTIPPLVVSELAWFESVRERVPKLRDEWKDLDMPSQMKLRQQALRERLEWQIPAELKPPRPTPEKVSPEKHSIPKPK